METEPMNFTRTFVTAGMALAAIMIYSAAIAQTSASSPAAKSTPAKSAADSSKPSTAAEVEKWTTKQWDAAKKEWAKDKKKWADCRKQSREQKLDGRKSWSFLYKCMTS
jgi:hypothetical protein